MRRHDFQITTAESNQDSKNPGAVGFIVNSATFSNSGWQTLQCKIPHTKKSLPQWQAASCPWCRRPRRCRRCGSRGVVNRARAIRQMKGLLERGCWPQEALNESLPLRPIPNRQAGQPLSARRGIPKSRSSCVLATIQHVALQTSEALNV